MEECIAHGRWDRTTRINQQSFSRLLVKLILHIICSVYYLHLYDISDSIIKALKKQLISPMATLYHISTQ